MSFKSLYYIAYPQTNIYITIYFLTHSSKSFYICSMNFVKLTFLALAIALVIGKYILITYIGMWWQLLCTL